MAISGQCIFTLENLMYTQAYLNALTGILYDPTYRTAPGINEVWRGLIKRDYEIVDDFNKTLQGSPKAAQLYIQFLTVRYVIHMMDALMKTNVLTKMPTIDSSARKIRVMDGETGRECFVTMPKDSEYLSTAVSVAPLTCVTCGPWVCAALQDVANAIHLPNIKYEEMVQWYPYIVELMPGNVQGLANNIMSHAALILFYFQRLLKSESLNCPGITGSGPTGQGQGSAGQGPGLRKT